MDFAKKSSLIAIFSQVPSREEWEKSLDDFNRSFDIENSDSQKNEESKILEFLILNNTKISQLFKSTLSLEHQAISYLEWIANKYFSLDKGQIKRYNEIIEFISVGQEIINNKKGEIYKKWGKENIEFIKGGVLLLSEWHIFFFSYTLEGSDVINDYFHSNKSDESVFATKIATHLWRKTSASQREEDFFYNKNNIKTSAEWEKQIKKASQTSFAMVQLIHDGIFHGNPKSNFAYMEYKNFIEMQTKNSYLNLGEDNTRIHFLLVDINKNNIVANPIIEFNDWGQDICKKHFKEISYRSNKIDELTDSINQVANFINKTAVDIINKYIQQYYILT